MNFMHRIQNQKLSNFRQFLKKFIVQFKFYDMQARLLLLRIMHMWLQARLSSFYYIWGGRSLMTSLDEF